MPFVNEDIENRDRHTIDKERNIILKGIGSSPDGEKRFKLVIDGEEVRFAGTSGMKYCREPKLGERVPYDMNWHIFRLHLPESYTSKKQEVLKLIEEALHVYGDNYHTENANSVSIKFDDCILKDDMGAWKYVLPEKKLNV